MYSDWLDNIEIINHKYRYITNNIINILYALHINKNYNLKRIT